MATTGPADFQGSGPKEELRNSYREDEVKSFCQLRVYTLSLLCVLKNGGFSSEIIRNQKRLERKKMISAVLTSKISLCQVSKVNYWLSLTGQSYIYKEVFTYFWYKVLLSNYTDMTMQLRKTIFPGGWPSSWHQWASASPCRPHASWIQKQRQPD